MWTFWIPFFIGLYLVISGFFSVLVRPWNIVVFGLLAVATGFLPMITGRRTWQGVIICLAGFWLFISGLFFNLVVSLNFYIFGAVIAAASLWGALASSSEKDEESRSGDYF